FHLLGNMFYLWLFGGALEQRLGSIRYLVLYLCSGILAGFFFATFNPDLETPLIGASGAVSGIIGAVAVLYSKKYVKTFVFGKIIPLHIWLYITVFIFSNLYIALRQHLMGVISVAWSAHLIGLVSGIVLVHLFRVPKERS